MLCTPQMKHNRKVPFHIPRRIGMDLLCVNMTMCMVFLRDSFLRQFLSFLNLRRHLQETPPPEKTTTKLVHNKGREGDNQVRCSYVRISKQTLIGF